VGIDSTITFQCLKDGTAPLHLATLSEDPPVGTTLFDPIAVNYDTATVDSSVTCGAGSAEATPTSTSGTPSPTPVGPISTPTPLPPGMEVVALVSGCNPVAATWANGTAIATVAGAVAPPEALEAIWKFDPATGTWKGYSPSVPAAVNDLTSVDQLDAIFVCVNAAATIGRPMI
jgi:hypothetical protein